MRLGLLFSLALTAACAGKGEVPGSSDDTGAGGAAPPQDEDRDGYGAAEDCDDTDPSVHPDAEEVCDGLDNDCDGETDEVPGTFYADGDGDGYGGEPVTGSACEPPAGAVAVDGDCDDGDPTVHPEAEEADCSDPVDYNCDGSVGFADADGDGTPACEDCDDGDAALHPGADETCDEVDNDCDGLVDDDPVDPLPWFLDADGDAYGDPLAGVLSCAAPEGYIADASDCDDGDVEVNPGAAEVCNGRDDDCDGVVDSDAVDRETWYSDADGDAFGDPSSSALSCDAPSGMVADATDCDDGDADVNPDAAEVCDGLDDDCDGVVDSDAVDRETWYSDADGDDFGDPSRSALSCDAPSGMVADATDCDDGDADINPDATEVCNGLDDDCDRVIDSDAVDGLTWYLDDDGDGFGDPDGAVKGCAAPSGAVADASDCDDGDGDINPDAEDLCDGLDNDCDGDTDPTGVDSDGDGTANCVDPTVYSYDFDDGLWTDWDTVDLSSSSSWKMDHGYLSEKSNSANSIAYGPDLGALDTYTVSVDMYPDGTSSKGALDGAGLVFAYQDEDNFWMARWLDPTDYYNRYTNKGRVDLYQCVAASCSVIDTDDGSRNLSKSKTWVTMSVRVDGADITVTWNGIDLISATASSSPVGADRIGVWSDDNDDGFRFDNIEVTNP